ncbi:hypothetical protein ACFQPF_15350 [Fictibacillus iocasae]|uniref:Type 4 fimbrial biogenesis protein PilX N-terminal domain-containing protein n=1 Tax=Fictibacillus iocasae TaxID=2715437 RepID=A0ABW2NRE5_9BACL
MRKLLDERGNSLIIVLLMIVIFTVAGLSLFSATLSGKKKTDVREGDVQATELAEKGIDYLSVLLETQTKSLAGKTAAEFNTKLTDIIREYEVTGLNTGKQLDSKVFLKIDQRRIVNPADPNDLTQQMTLHSTSKVMGKNGKEYSKTISSTIRLGAKTVPDALKYALGAYNPCRGFSNCTEQPDDGNMFIHGGVAIKGDLYVERNLVTKSTGIYGTSTSWIPSDLPSVEGENGAKAHLILPGSLYKLTGSPDYSTHINRTTFTSQNNYSNISLNDPSAAFTSYTEAGKHYVPVVDNRIPNFTPIDIEGQRSRFQYSLRGAPFIVEELNDGNFNNNPNHDHIRDKYMNENVYTNTRNDIKMNGSHHFKRLSTPSGNSTYISGKDTYWSSIKFTNGAYFGGDVTIGNTSETQYNADSYQKFAIDGPMFIDGDLTIWGANVKFNSSIYVTGKTTIRYSRLEGIRDNQNVEQSVIVFGKGPILIANNNVYRDTPNIIRGFFYSEDMMQIYGVGSNVEIHGGVFGRKLVLNATRGSVRQGAPIYDKNKLIGYEPDIYEQNQQNLSPSRSRLKIIYNPELIKNPPQGLPKVTDLAVTTVDRAIK